MFRQTPSDNNSLNCLLIERSSDRETSRAVLTRLHGNGHLSETPAGCHARHFASMRPGATRGVLHGRRLRASRYPWGSFQLLGPVPLQENGCCGSTKFLTCRYRFSPLHDVTPLGTEVDQKAAKAKQEMPVSEAEELWPGATRTKSGVDAGTKDPCGSRKHC